MMVVLLFSWYCRVCRSEIHWIQRQYQPFHQRRKMKEEEILWDDVDVELEQPSFSSTSSSLCFHIKNKLTFPFTTFLHGPRDLLFLQKWAFNWSFPFLTYFIVSSVLCELRSVCQTTAVSVKVANILISSQPLSKLSNWFHIRFISISFRLQFHCSYN